MFLMLDEVTPLEFRRNLWLPKTSLRVIGWVWRCLRDPFFSRFGLTPDGLHAEGHDHDSIGYTALAQHRAVKTKEMGLLLWC